MMIDEFDRIEALRERLQIKPDTDCRKELAEILEILNDVASVVCKVHCETRWKGKTFL